MNENDLEKLNREVELMLNKARRAELLLVIRLLTKYDYNFRIDPIAIRTDKRLALINKRIKEWKCPK